MRAHSRAEALTLLRMAFNVSRVEPMLHLAPRPIDGMPLLAVLALILAGPVAAQTVDRLGPVAMYSLAYDDNVLGLPSSQTNAGATARSDITRTLQVGLQIQKTIGRQYLSADLRGSDVKYDRLTRLDYQGRDLKAEWVWQAGQHLRGAASAKYMRSLMSFDDYHILERRIQSVRAEHVDVRWQLHPRWELVAAGTGEKISYDTDLLRDRSRSERFGDLGLDYVTPAGNTAGLVARRTVGTYPSSPNLTVFPFADDFEQSDVRLRVDWNATGKVKLRMDGGFVSRQHKTLNAMDFRGTNARLDLDWDATVKSALYASLWRELGVIDDLVAYSINKGASVRYSWSITTKVRSEMGLLYESRDLPRSPASAPASTDGGTMRRATWSTEYALGDRWLLRASVFRTLKDGSGATTSFSRNGATVTLQYQFPH